MQIILCIFSSFDVLVCREFDIQSSFPQTQGAALQTSAVQSCCCLLKLNQPDQIEPNYFSLQLFILHLEWSIFVELE